MILQGFVFINSSMELNIEEKLKHELENNFEKESIEEKEFSIDFFDKAFNLVKEMINIEEYPKFIASSEFKEYFSKFGYAILVQKKIEKVEKKEENEIMDDVID